MAMPFSRTLRALEAESARGPLWAVLLVLLFVAAWLVWLFAAEVSVYETSAVAHLEAGRSGHAVQAPVLGQVAASYLALGQVVSAGQTLVELDARSEHLALDVERARHAAREHEMATLQSEISAQELTLQGERRTATAALDEARSQADAAGPASRFADDEMARLQGLREMGMITEVDFLRRRSEAERSRFTERSAALAVSRVGAEMRTRQGDRLARIERLRHEITVLEGQRATSAAEMKRLEFELQRRRIVSPVAGTVGNLAVLRPGGFVDEGDVLATVVPQGELHAVAEFPAARALGRIRPGQRARLRLQGFPWGQYGSLAATVTHVASEGRNGVVRVELAVERDSPLAARLEHGLGASADVEVEQVKPAVLLMRAAGRLAGTEVGSPGRAP